MTPHQGLPPCSMVITSGGLLVVKIASMGDDLYGLVASVADDGSPRYWGTWTSSCSAVYLPHRDYRPLVERRRPEALVPRSVCSPRPCQRMR
ncbi:hypothetical protein [Thermomonospora umbrina]|uniref:Uncharacterized protein n=1 Tax=Thermomonospora umbrina TaxID=111806 RepID=A0A3D9SWG1_9ACTN|nr:hypothetical protein [Thermomonospora umbrina]REE98363.1 hypothetical protein DFJ69_3850 [Thermomonospora umbrina]